MDTDDDEEKSVEQQPTVLGTTICNAQHPDLAGVRCQSMFYDGECAAVTGEYGMHVFIERWLPEGRLVDTQTEENR